MYFMRPYISYNVMLIVTIVLLKRTKTERKMIIILLGKVNICFYPH